MGILKNWQIYIHHPLVLLGLNSTIIGLLTLIPFWQLIVIPCLIVGWLAQKSSKSFFTGFLSTVFGWGIYYLITLLRHDSAVLANYFTNLLFGNFSIGWIILLLSLLIGGLVGGLSGYLGYIGYEFRKRMNLEPHTQINTSKN